MRQAVILVGGRGTRLGNLAKDAPKPLLPVIGETPFLDLLIENIARHGVREILLLGGHMAGLVQRRYAGVTIRDCGIRVLAEPEPAGTAGALLNASDALDDAFLMLNGDSLFDVNYLALEHALQSDDQAVMALRRVPDASRFGRVDLQGDRVIGFHEKDAAFQGEALISAGVYVLRKRVIDLIAKSPCSIETDVFPRLAERGALRGVESAGYFIDIGLPETLGEARAEFADRMRRAAILFDRDGTLIRDDGYTHKLEDLVWQPGAIEAVRAVNDAGALAIVVTNQAGIARGYYDEAHMHAFHAHMQAELAKHGAHIDAFYFCPHHGDGVIPKYTHANHPDRKPNPGMLRRALTEWPIDSARCVMIGDTDLDTAAAAGASVRGVKVAPGDLAPVVQAALQSDQGPRSVSAETKRALKDRAAAARAWLFNHALPLWWNTGYDRTAACFHERIALDGAPRAEMARRIRVQARQTIVYAYARRLGWTGPWRKAVEAGARVLTERGLRADGGTRHLLSPDGRPVDDRRDLYDLAFVVFALAEAAKALVRPDLATRAADLVGWAETHWAHPHGGFHEGDITPTPPRRQNPHMHVFEALLALHEASGDPAHLARAGLIARLLRDRVFDDEHGALPEYFEEDWTPRRDQSAGLTEPGHHFEWAWLLDRWRRLGGDDFSALGERLRVHAEVYGVEPASGVVFEEVHADGRPLTLSSRFWPHTERLKANVVRYERTRDPRAAAAAVQAFDTLMRYCDTPTKGLWRDRLQADGSFVEEAAPASSFYHAMLGLSELIRVADALD